MEEVFTLKTKQERVSLGNLHAQAHFNICVVIKKNMNTMFFQ